MKNEALKINELETAQNSVNESAGEVVKMRRNDIVKFEKNKTIPRQWKFNPELWALYTSACEKENIDPVSKLTSMLIDFAEDKGVLVFED